jgi:hypothetical protein
MECKCLRHLLSFDKNVSIDDGKQDKIKSVDCVWNKLPN